MWTGWMVIELTTWICKSQRPSLKVLGNKYGGGV
uniref:Uncharacterized protein n=1 Tax=Picea sitchensis TaxID=3332 RepID=A9NK91_PICSI|nr:unknown [Picea sitchensis]